MVHVAHLTSVHPPFDVRIFHKECRSLVERGYRVSLVAPHTEATEASSVQIIPLRPPRNRIARMTTTVCHLARIARKLDAELYHFHDPELLPLGMLLRSTGKKVIYDVHEDVPATFRDKRYLPSGFRSLLGKLVGTLEKGMSRSFSALVTATPVIEERFRRIHSRVVTIHNFPRIEEFRDSRVDWSSRPKRVVYIGAISKARGAFQMLQAMELLADRSVTLELAGSMSPAEMASELSGRSGWERVKYHGILGRDGVAGLLARARVGLVVLQPQPRYEVSYPTKLFEYMAAGIPVVASDFSVWRDIVERAGCGLLVDPRSPRAIAAAIDSLIADPGRAAEMGERGRTAIETSYNWRQEEKRLHELYAELLEPRPVT